MKIIGPLLLLLMLGTSSFSQTRKLLSVSDFEKATQAKPVQLLDVRTAPEFKEGYINGAVNADWQNETLFTAEAGKLDKTKPVYVYCLSGIRSGKAADWLSANGFKEVINLDGGIKAWKAAEKKVVIKK